MYGNAADASEALAGGLTELEARGGHRFEVRNLRRRGSRRRDLASGEISFTDTRVVTAVRCVCRARTSSGARRGRRDGPHVDLARQLEARITAVLGNGR